MPGCNWHINYSLISAVRNGELEEAKKLIDTYGLSYSPAWSEGYNLLRDAVQKKQTAIAKLLLMRGCKVNSKSRKPTVTPLHFAATNGDLEIVKMILDRNAEINAIDSCGRTPLYDAIQNNQKEVTELLLNYGAYVNTRDEIGKVPLHVAVETGCLQIVKILLKYGADINCLCYSVDKRGYVSYAPLHFAVENNNKEIIMFLLSEGADVDIKGEDGITPFHVAAKKGYMHIAKDLLNHGACIHSSTSKEGYMPLHFASELCNEETVKFFLDRGADINASTKSNLTPLHIATKAGHISVVKLLIQYGAEVNNQDKDVNNYGEDISNCCLDVNNQNNRSSLKTAVLGIGENYEKILEALLEYGFKISPEDANDPKLLHAAVEKRYLKIIEDLLKYGTDVNALDCLENKGFTPLHRAAKNKQEEVAKLLINYGANVNAQDEIGQTPLFYAVENKDSKIVKLLLKKRAIIKDISELLKTAVKEGWIEVVESLLQHDVDINATDKHGRTLLHFIFNVPGEENKGKIAKLLLSKGANVNSQTEDGETTLHAASQKGYTKVVEALLEYDANVNCVMKSGITPLHLSADKGNEEITKMLLNKGANVNAKQTNGTSALHIASANGHKDIVKLLLEWGAEVDSKTKNNITPLHLSAKAGNEKITKMLLNKGANINTKNTDGSSALHIAAAMCHVEVVKVLLEYGTIVDSRMERDITPLYLGAENDHHEIFEIVLKMGVDINSRDADGRTALHIAAEKENERVIAALLDYGFDINATNKNNKMPFDLAMVGIISIYNQMKNYRSDEDDYYFDHPIFAVSYVETLRCHIAKMVAANLYVSEKNLLCIDNSDEIIHVLEKCKEEIRSMKSEKINNANISFYDILTKSTVSLAMCMRNENIVHALKSAVYKTKFPIYANMIENQFRKGLERKLLLEQSSKIFTFLFKNCPELSTDCVENIFSYLNDTDLRIFINACKGFCNSISKTNIHDVIINPQISQAQHKKRKTE